MKRMALLAGAVLIGAALVGVPRPAQASFHIMQIVEVFGGTAAQPNAQFIELKMYADNQHLVAGLDVDVFNASGASVGTFTFASNVANSSSQDSILLATPDAATLFDITPDLSMTSAPITPSGGKVCFESVDCVSWGTYSGSTTSPSATGTPEPIMCNSLVRDLGSNGVLDGTDDTNDSEGDFESGVPSPRNNARQLGTSSLETCFSFMKPLVRTEAELSPGPNPVTISVRGMGTSSPATVEYLVSDGSATGGNDYEFPSPNPGVLSFDAGEGFDTFDVNILDDAEVESTEDLTVTLQEPSVGSVRGPAFTIDIVDDDAPPEVTEPVMQAPTAPFQRSKAFRVAWTRPSDAADVRVKAATSTAGFGAETFWKTGTTSTQATYSGKTGNTYCFSARSRTAAGDLSGFSSQRCTAVPLDDRALKSAGPWAKKRGKGYYLNTFSQTSKKGAALSKGVRAKRLSLLATKGPGHGTVKVFFARKLLKKVSLAASRLKKKQLISVGSFASAKKGTLRVVVVSSGKVVRIEGLGVSAV